jgi:ubiquinone/menaquinone biosynthesis C-methylase UbiE
MAVKAPQHVGETLVELPGLRPALDRLSGAYLEIGVGYGARLRALIDSGATKGFSRFVVVDASAERIAFARVLLPEAEALVGDAQHLPFADESIDFVFSDQVIEHVASDAAMAREMYRLLRPNGEAYVGSVFKHRWGWYFYRNGGKWRLDPTHVREYESLQQYRRVFEGVGFSVVAETSAQVAFPLGEALLRPIVHAGALSGGAAYDVHGRSPVLRTLSHLRVPIPGYHFCWIHLRK